MSEWWTYRPSDFLLFAPRIYYRLIELYNLGLWPAHVAALAVAVLLLTLAWRGDPRAGRVVAVALAIAWGFVGWRFHWRQYSTINWAAVHFAWAFALQAALLGAAALAGGLEYGPVPSLRRYGGLAVAMLGLAVQPLAALALGRPWTQVEVAGLSPDPTALLTLGLLVGARRAHGSLFALPVLWCLVSGVTLWTMQAADAIVPVSGALAAVAVAIGGRFLPRPTAAR